MQVCKSFRHTGAEDLLRKKGCAPLDWRSFLSLKRYSTWHRSVEWHMVWPKQKHPTLPRVPLSFSSNINWVSCYPECGHDTINKATCKLMMKPVSKDKKKLNTNMKSDKDRWSQRNTDTLQKHTNTSKTWVSHLLDTLTVQPSVGI